MYTRDELILLARLYVAAKGITVAALSREVMGPPNSKFFAGLFAGGDCLVSSVEKASRWFNRNWPADVSWPLGRRPRFPSVTALRRSG